MRQPKIDFASFSVLSLTLAFAALTNPGFASTDFLVPPGRSANPYAIVVGADHNLWFTEQGGEKIGRITTGGVITEFPIPGAQSLVGIASGSDGNLWFTDQLMARIGRISTSGTGIKEFPLPTGGYPQGITAGPDGNLWFVEQTRTGFFKIGKISVSGNITEYETGIDVGKFQFSSASGYGYGAITTGPDGNLWFVNPQNFYAPLIGQITTSGVVTFYVLDDFAVALTAGPDGNLWATELNYHVAKITTSGVETEYALSRSGWTGITTGPDGNIWFTEFTSHVAKVTPAGAVTEYATLFPTVWSATSLVSGPDGALWTTGNYNGAIARIAAMGVVTNSYDLTAGSEPAFTAFGPDGNVWFTEIVSNRVGKITPSGTITTYPIPTANAEPWYITPGPDGNLWFIEAAANQVAKVTPGGVVTEYPMNGSAGGGITSGPDGNLWFTDTSSNTCSCSAIGRITPSGTITKFPTITPSSSPAYITAGPEGNLWFTEYGTSSIGSITTSGVPLNEYLVPGPFAYLSVITMGPDGNLWFLENTQFGAVAKMTTSGIVTEYGAQLQNYQEGLVVAGDGAIWFTQGYPNTVGRITTSGVLSEVQLTTPNAVGNSVSVGSDGKLWVGEGTAGRIGRLSAVGGTGDNISATNGVLFTGTVATFTDATPTATASNFTATVYWGDGAATSGSVSGAAGGPFYVTGSHTYNRLGTFRLLVALHDGVDNSTYESTLGKTTVN